MVAVLAMLVATMGAAAQTGPRWTRLGTRNVTDRADHDVIVVTAAEGRFNAVQFRVRGHAVDFRRVVIHFANGGDQNVEMRDTIRAGGESRAIDVDGTDRVIRSIEFWSTRRPWAAAGERS